MRRILFLSIIALLLTAPALIGAEYSLSPSDYAIIEPGVGHGNEGGQRILLSFDLPEGIDNQPITRAYIRFAFNFPVGDNTASTEFRVYSLTSSWNSETVGWDTWTNNGGDFDDFANTFAFETGRATDFHIDVTDQVQRFANGELTNYGFILIPIDFDGEEYDNINVGNFNMSNLVRLELKYGFE